MLAVAPAVPAGAEPLPSNLEFVIPGGGWGHGHGMSQYGARAQAETGRGWREILGHYYTGIDFRDLGAERIRVLLASGGSMVVGGPERVTARWRDGDDILQTTAADPYARVRTLSEGVAIDRGPSADGPWRQVTSGKGRVRFTADEGPAVPVVTGDHLHYYRGRIEAYRRTGSTVYTINDLPMDEYLYGVVPREMPSSWHGQALRAQAVAARSYSAWKKANAGSESPYHICATTMCQVYSGYAERASHGSGLEKLERDATNAAVDDTSGTVMTYEGDAIFAEYHSSSGGHTAQGSRPYLAPVPDPWDEEFSPHHRWTARIKVSEIEDRWPAIGRLTDIAILDRDGQGPWGGRVNTMAIAGTDGSVTISGDTFRASFWWPQHADGLRSRLFTVRLYDAEPVEPPAEVVLSPGESADVSLRFTNTGTIAWGDTVRLATADPHGRESAFGSGWLSGLRVAALAGPDPVEQDGTGEFRFAVRAPADAVSGLYEEAFQMVAGDDGWFGPVVRLPVRVRLPGAAHLGANLVENPSFDAAAESRPAGWLPLVPTETDVRDTEVRIDGRASVRLDGDPGERKAYTQTIPVSGEAGERLVFSAWNRSRGTSKDGRRIDAVASLVHVDGGTSLFRVSFPQRPHAWTYRETAITAPRDFDRIEVSVNLRRQSGQAWFDRVYLARNALTNGGFEAADGWTLVRARDGDGIDDVHAQSGMGSLRIRGRDATVYARQPLTPIGIEGETYRLSGWNRTAGTRAGGGAVRLWARVRHADGSIQRHLLDFPRAPHEWRYGETLFTTTEPYVGLDVFAKVRGQIGTVWFDEVSLARARDRRSLTANPDFEVGSPKPGAWTIVNTVATETVSTASAIDGDASLYLEGKPARTIYARQRVPVAGDAGDRFRLSGWNKTSGSTVAGGPIRVWARVRYVDGTMEAHRIDFARDPHGWAYGVLRFTTERPYRRIDVFSKLERQTGRAWFDSVRLEVVRSR